MTLTKAPPSAGPALARCTGKLATARAKLDDIAAEHAALIVAYRQEGHTLRAVAELAGVSHQTVKNICQTA